MRYELSQKKITTAKKLIREVKQKQKIWEEEVTIAKALMKTCANKHYHNRKKAYEYALQRVECYKEKTKEIKEMIKKGYIEI